MNQVEIPPFFKLDDRFVPYIMSRFWFPYDDGDGGRFQLFPIRSVELLPLQHVAGILAQEVFDVFCGSFVSCPTGVSIPAVISDDPVEYSEVFEDAGDVDLRWVCVRGGERGKQGKIVQRG